MKKLILWSLLAFSVAIGSAFAWVDITSQLDARETAKRVHDRMAYWKSVVESGVNIGETRDEALAWLRTRFPKEPPQSPYDPRYPALVVTPETVTVVGTHFPCAAWVILIDIDISPAQRVASRRVTSAGICV